MSDHIGIGPLFEATWIRVAWESHRAVLRFTSISHLVPLPVECRWGGHGRSALEGIQHPRPHRRVGEDLRNLLGALVVFAALVLFLSLLFTHTPSERTLREDGVVDWSEDEAFFLPFY